MQFHSQSDADILFARGQDLKAQGLNPYPHNFNRTYSLYEVNEDYEELTDDDDGKIVALNLCGRVMSIHDFGEVILVKIEDQDSGLQLSLDAACVGQDQFTTFRANVYRGDYLGFEVDFIYRQQGWITARIVHWQFLALCIFPLPTQFNDSERTYRQRYVQLAADMKARRQFVVQSKILQYTRRFLEDKYSFLEVSTPILASVPLSNDSRPVLSGTDSANLDAVLRSSAESCLKQLLVGGLERIYEIGPSFNNKALDWQNSPELRVIQCYMIVADLNAVMNLTEHLIVSLAQQLHATRVIPWKSLEQMLLADQQRKMNSDEACLSYQEFESEDILIDLIPSWSRRSVGELVQDITKINFANLDNLNEALNAARQAGVELNEANSFIGIVDVLKETIRQLVVPSLIQPTFLVNFPSEDLDFNPSSSGKCFELYMNGLKFAEGSSGLTDPWDYKEQQAYQVQHPQMDQTRYSDEVLTALKYGMPPSASVTIYLDRLIMLLTGAIDIRDVIYFPLIQRSE